MGTKTTGTARGRWVILTDESATTTHDEQEALAYARDVAARLDCEVVVTDRMMGSSVIVCADGSTDTYASRAIRARNAARRAGASRA